MRLTLDSFVTDSHNLLIYTHRYHWAPSRDRKTSPCLCCQKHQILTGKWHQSCCLPQWRHCSVVSTIMQPWDLHCRNEAEPTLLWQGEVYASVSLGFFAEINHLAMKLHCSILCLCHSPQSWADIVFMAFPEDYFLWAKPTPGPSLPDHIGAEPETSLQLKTLFTSSFCSNKPGLTLCFFFSLAWDKLFNITISWGNNIFLPERRILIILNICKMLFRVIMIISIPKCKNNPSPLSHFARPAWVRPPVHSVHPNNCCKALFIRNHSGL